MPEQMEGFCIAQDKQGNTALHLAATSHALDACFSLLDSTEGREAASVVNKAHQTAMHLAAGGGNLIAVRQLLAVELRAATMEDKSGRTPAQWATFRGHKVVPFIRICWPRGL
jgi:ankyrin repeat protein